MRCPACQQPVSPAARFCSACGSAVAVAIPSRVHARPALPIETIETVYAPLPYAYTPRPAARANEAPVAPAPYPYPPAPLDERDESYAPLGYAVPAAVPAYAAPFPAPAQAPAPSMVNNVTVTQVTPPAPAPTPAPVVADGDGIGLGVVLCALYFLLSGIATGVVWVAGAESGAAGAAVAAVMTILVLVLDIAILAHYHRR